MDYIQVLLLLAPVLVSGSGVTFNLTHERIENTFYLTCNVQNGSIDPTLVQFWINETEKIDIVSKADRVSWRYNIIAFDLEPQYEGTFYCGEADGEHSNGLGPFAGKLIMSRQYSTQSG